MAGDTVVNLAKQSNFMSAAIRAKAIRVGGDMTQNFKRAFESGVKIAYGTDSGVSKHGNNAREAILMFNAGMSPQQILKSATVNAADLIGQKNTLGSIEQGKIADIIAMKANPLDNIEALLTIDFVMKSGDVVKYTDNPGIL